MSSIGVPLDDEKTAMTITPERSAPTEKTRCDDPAAVDLAALISDGVALLGPKTQAVIDLTVRQGVTDTEFGPVIDLRDGVDSQRIVRTRERAELALSIFVLVKTRVNACPGLSRVVGAHANGSMTSDLTDIVEAHLDVCAGCADAWSRIPPPLDVLRGSPAGPPTSGIRDRFREHILRSPWGSRKIRAASVAAAVVLSLGMVAITRGSGAEAASGAEVTSRGEMAGAVEDLAVDVPASSGAERLSRSESVSEPASPGPTTTTTPHPTTSVVVEAEPEPAPTTPTAAVPSEPPLMTIITPINGQRFGSSSVIDLVAVVQDDIDEGLAVDWHAGATYIGSGNAITVTSASGCPDAVTYTVSATVTDSSGNTTREMVTFTVQCDNSNG